jgi:C_GCAxxG_C_C family probable redox protein
MTKHDEKAYELFTNGYNCAQAVLLAFSDLTGLDDETAARLSSSFGGGLGRMREVCGAVSGAAMVLGLLKGYADPADPSAKKEHYHRVQEFCRRFKEANGSIVCRELLSGVQTVEGRDPEQRTEAYYKKRPCPEIVRRAAKILDEMLSA